MSVALPYMTCTKNQKLCQSLSTRATGGYNLSFVKTDCRCPAIEQLQCKSAIVKKTSMIGAAHGLGVPPYYKDVDVTVQLAYTVAKSLGISHAQCLYIIARPAFEKRADDFPDQTDLLDLSMLCHARFIKRSGKCSGLVFAGPVETRGKWCFNNVQGLYA